jgi:hypothetical protein
MQMLLGIAWLSPIVVIRFVIDFFFQHVLDSWLRYHLQCLQGVAGGSIRRAKASIALSLPLSAPPERTS